MSFRRNELGMIQLEMTDKQWHDLFKPGAFEWQCGDPEEHGPHHYKAQRYFPGNPTRLVKGAVGLRCRGTLRGWVIAKMSDAISRQDEHKERMNITPGNDAYHMERIAHFRALAEGYARVVDELDIRAQVQ